jgi:integrase
MATLYKDPRSGTYVIQFFDLEGIRRTLRTGVTDRQGAEHIRWHIDNLLAARRAAIPLPAATADWLGRIDAQFRGKLEALGLVEPRAERRVPTLRQLIDEFTEYQKPRVKAPTLDVLHYVVKRLLTCLPEDTPIDQITPADADRAYQVFKAQLAQSTANKHISIVRSIFNFACEREYIAKNPFRHIRGLQAIGDSKRRQYIPTKQVRQLLEKIPDPELQLVIVLARWCGLRIPSEIQELRWRDILWKKNRIIVRSPKTEHHAGKGIRMPRLFGVVRRYLKALRRLRPDAGPDDHVFRPAVRCNPLWLIHLWCRRLGIKPWSKFFTNLRASCATDLIERYPNHVCLAWLGHTERVADTHYRMVTENYYRRRGKLTARKRKATLRSADAELMQRALHQERPGASIECTDQVSDSENCPENTPDRQSWTPVDKCPGVYRGHINTAFFLGKPAFFAESAANCAATGQKIRENPDGHTGIAVANAQAVAGQEAATGRMARPTTERNRRTRAGTGNRQTGTESQDAKTSTESQRTARQPLPVKADITDTQTPIHQEAKRTGTGAGTGLADVLRAIASLSETDRELLLQLLKTLQGANT